MIYASKLERTELEIWATERAGVVAGNSQHAEVTITVSERIFAKPRQPRHSKFLSDLNKLTTEYDLNKL